MEPQSRMQHMPGGGLSFTRFGQGQSARRPIMDGEVHGKTPMEEPAPPSTSLEALKEGAGQALAAWRGIERAHGITESPFPIKQDDPPQPIAETLVPSVSPPVQEAPLRDRSPSYADGTPMQVGDVVVFDEALYEVKGRDFDGGVIVEGPGVGSRTVSVEALGQCRILKRKV